VIERVAYLSMHTSPLLQPGTGWAGGMNVYIDELSHVMAERGVDVVVYTRRTDPGQPDVVHVAPGYRVTHVTAGPQAPLPIAEMAPVVGEFTEGVLKALYAAGDRFDVVHSHYWLSGWAGVLIKEALGVPLANSFHTLGRIKDLNRRPDEAPSSPVRLLTEQEVIAQSDCVIASTPFEFEDLLDHYGANPERLCTSPPGIDHEVFAPGDRAEARRWLGLSDAPLVLYVGRIQPLKGIDVAVSALPLLTLGATPAELLIVGGPSGPAGDAEVAHINELAARLGVSTRVHMVPPQPHDQLARFYQAADVLVMPSRSESFGLVAAEAQGCGLPVVAAAVGGLPYVVQHEVSGLLVSDHDPADYADALAAILGDPQTAERLSSGALEHAERFSWPATANRLLELYAGITGG
jgi:D-inositol-3-phosphate glycosyltransferase